MQRDGRAHGRARTGGPHAAAGGDGRAEQPGAHRRDPRRGAGLRDPDGRVRPHRAVQSRRPSARSAIAATKPSAISSADLIIAADKRAAHRDDLARYLASGEATVMNRRLELTAVRKGGESFRSKSPIAPISSDGTAMFAGYMRDITERRPTKRRSPTTPATSRPRTRPSGRTASSWRRWSLSCGSLSGRAEDATRAKSDFLAEHEPRAADAAERDHPLQRAAAGAGRGRRRRQSSRSPICRKSSRPASICSSSSTAFSTSRKSRPARWRCRARRSR